MRQGLPSCRSFSWQSDFPWAGACRFPKPTHSASRCTPGIPCSFCKPGLLPPPASPHGQPELLRLRRPFWLLEQAPDALFVPFSLSQLSRSPFPCPAEPPVSAQALQFSPGPCGLPQEGQSNLLCSKPDESSEICSELCMCLHPSELSTLSIPPL